MIIQTQEEQEILREGGRLLATFLQEILDMAAPGVSMLDMDALAEKRIREAGGIPAFKNYGADKRGNGGFPGTICASLNDEVVHGIPTKDKIIQDGDLVKVDIGMRYKGLVTDMARTIAVGNVSPDAQQLLDVTRDAFYAGVETIHAGSSSVDFGRAVQKYAQSYGYGVVRDLVGHGVGRELHEGPEIPNYVSRRSKFTFQENMVVALEPMINVATWEIQQDNDGWTIRTADGELSAHWENTLIVTKDGAEIVTLPAEK